MKKIPKVLMLQDGVEYALYPLDHLVHKRGRKDVSLILAGDGNRQRALRDLARDLHLESYVNFVGWVAPEDVFLLIYLAWVLAGIGTLLVIWVGDLPIDAS